VNDLIKLTDRSDYRVKKIDLVFDFLSTTTFASVMKRNQQADVFDWAFSISADSS